MWAGNSLGGGLANYVASQNEVRSVTYNPAILPEGSYDLNNSRITNYMSEYDPLTLGEMAAGYDSRFPGKCVKLQNNMPWMGTMISNHVGYGDSVTIGGKQIQIEADAYLPIGIWSGAILTGGTGQKIAINPKNMQILASSLATRMTSQVKDAQSFLDEAADIVIREGSNLDNRTSSLNVAFDDLLKQTSFGQVLVYAEAYEQVRNEVEKINPIATGALDIIQRIRTAPFISDVLDFLSMSPFSAVEGFLNIPFLIGDTLLKLEDIVDRVGQLKREAIPKLFRGIDNEFLDDGMVAELREHYMVLDRNKDVVVNQILTFSDQVGYVAREIEKADKLLTETERIEGVAAPPATAAFSLEESSALKTGMGKKQTLVDKNFNDFKALTCSSLKPALANLRSTINQLGLVLEDGLGGLKTIRGALGMLDIPFVDFDDSMRDWLDGVIAEGTQYLMMLDGLENAVRNGELNLDGILAAYRPYIDTALFEGTKFQDVILLNKLGFNLFESARIVFNDIRWQLSENEAAAITALDGLAGKVCLNLETLIGQIKRGSINV